MHGFEKIIINNSTKNTKYKIKYFKTQNNFFFLKKKQCKRIFNIKNVYILKHIVKRFIKNMELITKFYNFWKINTKHRLYNSTNSTDCEIYVTLAMIRKLV